MLDESVQEAWSNVPPALSSLQDTYPVTIEAIEASASVAVSCTLDPWANVTGFGVRVVLVSCFVVIVRPDAPALPE